MAELGELLGTLLSSLAHARRIADEETTAIAEYYKDNPLLEGLSLPRIRVPEMVLDLPLLIESHEKGEANTPQATGVIVKALVTELKDSAKQLQVELPTDFIAAFTDATTKKIGRSRPTTKNTNSFPREIVVRAVDQSFRMSLKKQLGQQFTQNQINSIVSDLRRKASEVALKKVGNPPVIEASIITAVVKEKASATNVSRLRIVLKEEGLEWSVSEDGEGNRSQTLTPE